jgi:hypothetical protein
MAHCKKYLKFPDWSFSFIQTIYPTIKNHFSRIRNFNCILLSILICHCVHSQSVQIIAGIGKNEIRRISEYPNNGNFFKTSVHQYYGLQFQFVIIPRISVSLGSGIEWFKYPVYSPALDTIPEKKVDEIKIHYLSFPVGIQYEVFRKFNLSLGMQLNINAKQKSEMTWFTNFYKSNSSYFAGANYTFFDCLQLGFIQQFPFKSFANVQTYNKVRASYKHKYWYFYLSYVYSFKRKDNSNIQNQVKTEN